MHHTTSADAGAESVPGRDLLTDGLEAAQLHWNLAAPALFEEAIRRGEGQAADGGALVCRTGSHTGRSPNDKFIVSNPETASRIQWGKVNRRFEPAKFDELALAIGAHVAGRDLFVQDCAAGADPAHRLRLRIITEHAWHSLFARHVFIARSRARARGCGRRFHGHRRPELHRRSGGARHELGYVHPPELRAKARR